MKNKNLGLYFNEIIGILFFLIVGTIAIKYFPQLVRISKNEALIQQTVQKFGLFGPVILVLLHILQHFIFIPPGPVLAFTDVYLYGLGTGLTINLIGTTIGSTLVFFIARELGKKKVKKFIDNFSSKRDLTHFEKMVEKDEKYALIISRLFPIFPCEIVTLICGLTEMDSEEFVLLNFLFFLPRIIIESIFYNEMKNGFGTPIGKFILFVGIGGVLIYIFRHPIKKLFIKELKHID